MPAPSTSNARSNQTRTKSDKPWNQPYQLNKELEHLASSHVNSFNLMLGDGLKAILEDVYPVVSTNDAHSTKVRLIDLKVEKPKLSYLASGNDRLMFPHHARESRTSYTGELLLTLGFDVKDNKSGERVQFDVQHRAGQLPIMVKSHSCNLWNKGAYELIERREEIHEVGGIFIINGTDKVFRQLLMSRRNDPLAIIRPSYKRLGRGYTKYSVVVRAVKTTRSKSNMLHYIDDGNISLRLLIQKREFLIPVGVVLKALIESSDREIYARIIGTDTDNAVVCGNAEIILRELKKLDIYTRIQALSFLGLHLRKSIPELDRCFPEASDEMIGEYILRDQILINQQTNQDKFNLLVFMIRKLLALAHGDIAGDSPDSPMNQELLLVGDLLTWQLREQVQLWMSTLAGRLDAHLEPVSVKTFSKVAARTFDIGKIVHFLLATGNLKSPSGLDIPQPNGLAVTAERINFLRYMSHLHSVHRGSFLEEVRSSEPRKLLPEAWGFICPVHTPDGAPCGLLNHLTGSCKIVTETKDPRVPKIPSLLESLGMLPLVQHSVYSSNSEYLTVCLDATVIGVIPLHKAKEIEFALRKLKTEQKLPYFVEVAVVLPPASKDIKSRFPGFFLFTSTTRMMRPVLNLKEDKIEYIGSLEQVFLDVACLDEDVRPSTTHKELDPKNIFSPVASLTPFSDFNQSPRNMYQCQMGKQTMAFPYHNFRHRWDNKIYRLNTPQSPIVRTVGQDKYSIDDFPTGTNAVVAVISYTGYDMEDAMIVNKSSYERGFAHATVYKTEDVELDGAWFASESENTVGEIDDDGLPLPGAKLSKGTPYYSIARDGGKFTIKQYKSLEDAVVEDVIVTPAGPKDPEKITKARIKLRLNRNPVIGDKFSSRHGQKGILSQLWPQRDMPFSESGLTPDVIINPNAFPSRMTIGMLIETMAGKSGALHGIYQDASPFKFDENNTALDYFGKQLLQAGYNYYGNEPLYSGVLGTEFHADIYIGVVYYQRLRHMVKDKYQVRSKGKVGFLHRQPVKGRKQGGGTRFGEMERDSLIAHGVSFLLQDRLMNGSDASSGSVCMQCGNMIGSTTVKTLENEVHAYCRFCDRNDTIQTIKIPHVFKYLNAELASFNIKMSFFPS